jgi:integrase
MPAIFAPPRGLDRRRTGQARARLHLPLFILLGLYTGQRKEAILSLRWAQVDLDAGRIDFNPPGRRRTRKQRPLIPIAPRLLRHLRRARRRGTDLGFVVNEDGHRLGDLKTGFGKALQRAGLEGVTPHDLRRTAATWMMQRGVEEWEACGFLGMTPETLRRVYAKHHPDFVANAARAFS